MRPLFWIPLILVLLLATGIKLPAQVAISNDGSLPHNSAMLEVKSDSKGFLPPRVALTASNLAAPVALPATGLLIYNTATAGTAPYNVTPGFYYWNGQSWIPAVLSPGSHPGDLLYWNGTQWGVVPQGQPGQFLQLSQSWVPTWVGNSFALISTSDPVAVNAEGAMVGGSITSDGGAPVTERGICFSIEPAPDVTDSVIICGSGTGNFDYTLTGLTGGTTYYVRAYAKTSVGVAYGNEVSFTTLTPPPTCPGIPTVNYGGKTYHTILIGAQCWLKENLNIGTRIANTVHQTNNGTLEKYCYDNLESNCDVYGGLYQWAEMVQYLNGATNISSWDPAPSGPVTGICPPGWSIPANSDWIQLATYLEGEAVAGGKMKETGTTHWSIPNTGASNTTGFTGLPGGWKHMDGYFSEIMLNGSFWTATEWSERSAYVKYLRAASANLGSTDHYKTYGYSVRCFKDSCTSTVPVSVTITAPVGTLCAGEPVSLTATPVNGGTTPSFQWKVNNIMVGTNSPTYTYTPTNGDQVVCILTSNLSCVSGNPATSNTVAITVAVPATVSVTIAASANPVTAGTAVTFTATPVNGGASPDYQWKVNGINAGSNSSNYTYNPADGDVITCVVTSNASCITGNPAVSNAITMVVNPAVQPCSGIPTVSYGGKTYNTIQIGTQCWLKENLDIGSQIPGLQDQTNNDVLEKYCYNDLEANCAVYGGLYQWNEAMQYVNLPGTRGICPSGWHIPSDQEWGILAVYLGGESTAGGTMKEPGTSHWANPNYNATNSSGFTGLPAGKRFNPLSFNDLTTAVYFWASTLDGSNWGYYRSLVNYTDHLYRYVSPQTYGYSVRCMKDTCSSYSTVSISIGTSANQVCSGTPVTLTAIPVNGGTAPVYHWKVNNVTAGTNSATYTFTPVDGDQVICLLTSNQPCVSGNPATSNVIAIGVTAPSPVSVTITASANPIAFGTPVNFTATPVNGGTSPGYQWKVNGIDAGSNSSNYTFTPVNGDVITCVVTSNAACITGNPAISNAITMVVNPVVDPCPGIPTVNYGGKTYNTVQIGTQCWFRENLDIGTRINGTIEQSDNGILEKYCYNDQESNCAVYGGMYQWNEMMQYVTSSATGICPPGWHIPSDGEWNDLQTILGSNPGGKMKEAGFTHWQSPNTGATNSSGFIALPGGLLYPAKNFDELTLDCYLWSSTDDGSSAPHRTLRYTTANLERYVNQKTFGFSVRCLKDNCPSLDPVSVSINTSAEQVCAGTLVTFTAIPVNGGNAPTYQWKVNNLNVGTNSPTYTYAPADGDQVLCVLTSNQACVSGNPATSNKRITAVVQPFPVSVTISASANPVGSGTQVIFTANEVNGGANPVYQWKVNGNNTFSGASSYTYTPVNNDVVTCVLTSSMICVTGNPATSNAITMQVAAPGGPCPGTPSVIHGGKTYNTVQIGQQCWFKENLNIGMKIPPTFNQTDNGLIEKYCYDDLETDCSVYGGLYQWAELVQYMNGATNTTSWSPVPSGNVQGLCPSGWHIPSDDEWVILSNNLGGESIAGGKMKETGLLHWWDPNLASNSSGFTALGSGIREPDATFIVLDQYTNFWSSTENGALFSWSRALGHWSESLWRDGNYDKTKGFSVRCLKGD
ncbi:MAG: FISUMP domain-containing protein [Bacteroidales bacterium]|nr:FISUMP domain-containing protein [Bacteroidales bacterium]